MGNTARVLAIIDALDSAAAADGQRAAAVAASEDASEEIIFFYSGAGLMAPPLLIFPKFFLDGVPGFQVDDRLVAAVKYLDIGVLEVPADPAVGPPAKLSDIDRVAEDVFHGAVFHKVAVFGADAHVVEGSGDFAAALAVKVPLENLADQRREVGVGDQLFPLAEVAEGGAVDGVAPADGLLHTPEDLAGKADAVVFVHPFNNPLDQAAEGAVDGWLGDADNLDTALPQEHRLIDDAFLLVPGEAGELPDQDRRKGVVLAFGGADHPLELRAFIGFAAADALFLPKNVLVGEDQVMGFGVVPEKLQLAVGAVFCLVVGADPDIAGGKGKVFHGDSSFRGKITPALVLETLRREFFV